MIIGKMLTRIFPDAGASSTRDCWKIQGARRRLQGNVAVCRSRSRHVSDDLVLLVVEHDRSRQQDHDGEER